LETAVNRRRYLQVALAVACVVASAARAQTVSDHLAQGSRDRAARDAAGALRAFEAALSIDAGNYDALVNAAECALELGEFNGNAEQRDSLFRSAEQYARRAVAANPNGAEGHFELAQALGRTALTQGPRDRIKYAIEVRDQALAALKIDSRHSGALHVMGVWNAEVMRLNGFTRMLAKKFLGGNVFNEANWDAAQRYMEQSVAADSARIAHRLDLGSVYADRKMRDQAVAQFEWIARAPITDFNDPHYKEQAARKLKDLK
jgi:tetratricopeptide (TPR) repeat protein